MRTTVDIGMRLVMQVHTYEQAGRLMDAVQAAVTNELPPDGDSTRARFDFTHVNTHPCKSAQMAQLAMDNGGEPAVPGPDDF